METQKKLGEKPLKVLKYQQLLESILKILNLMPFYVSKATLRQISLGMI
jgi:hypothetical protein